ncbi:MAG: NTP transferase domain-containing protein [Candidatus Aegiribacteria sp.]|nr:NTP transferase domain-containing protein [Candidatus Aegiribacteria sp.]
MKSPLPKVVHQVLGVPMVIRVVRQAVEAGLDSPVVVVGHSRESVIPILEQEGASWALQEEQLGTAHAVTCGLKDVSAESVMILLGDVPLLKSCTISELEESRRKAGAAIAVLSTCPPDPSGYGRIIREGDLLRAIVEDSDCTRRQLEIGEINTGLMSFDGGVLPELLGEIRTDNDQGEYYLTDAVSIAMSRGMPCIAVLAEDHREVSGVNNRVQLACATENLRKQVLDAHMIRGVNIPDPGGVWIEESVEIGTGVSIGRSVRLSGMTVIGDNCIVGDGSILIGSDVAPGAVIEPYTVTGWKAAR